MTSSVRLIIEFILFWGLVNVTLVLPGFALLRRLKIFASDTDSLCFGYAVSIGLFAVLALAHFVLGVSFTIIALLSLVLFGASGYDLWRCRRSLHLTTLLPFVVMLVMSATSLVAVALPLTRPSGYIPDPTPIAGRAYDAFNVKILNLAHTPANDNYIPFRQAQFFTDRLSISSDSFIKEWSVNFFYRTPLMGAVTAYYFDLLGESPPRPYLWALPPNVHTHIYEQFQIIAHILNSLFIIPGYLLIRRLFQKRVARLTILFIAFSPFMLYNTYFSWPKSLVAYFILCSWILIIKHEKPFLAGGLAGLAYLTHDLSVLYIAGSIAYISFGRGWLYLLKMGSAMLALALPWLATARLIYHQTSLFFYYPFALYSIPSNPDHVITNFLHTPLRTIAAIKLRGVYDLIGHLQFRHWFQRDWPAYVWADMLFTLPGAVGLPLVLAAYYGLIRHIRKDWRIILSFILVPILMLFTILGSPKALGLGAMHFAEVLVPLLTAYALLVLLKLGRGVTILALGAVITSYYFMVGFGYNFGYEGWLQPLPVLLISFMVIGHAILAISALCEIFERPLPVRILRTLLS